MKAKNVSSAINDQQQEIKNESIDRHKSIWKKQKKESGYGYEKSMEWQSGEGYLGSSMCYDDFDRTQRDLLRGYNRQSNGRFGEDQTIGQCKQRGHRQYFVRQNGYHYRRGHGCVGERMV